MQHNNYESLAVATNYTQACISTGKWSIEWASPDVVWLHHNSDGVQTAYSLYASSVDEVVKLSAVITAKAAGYDWAYENM